MVNQRFTLLFFKSIYSLMYFNLCCHCHNVSLSEIVENEFADLDSQILPLTYETLSLIFEPDWETKLEETLQLKATAELLSMPEIIKKNGYLLETHKIRTEDDYILEVHRIPFGKQRDNLENKPAVLIQHGILQSSEDWFRNEAGIFLPLLLAEEGFDVWLANSRGNKYSNEHLIFEEDSLQFYNFTFHEMGRYDLPATIDFILDSTNQTKLNYIGSSLGTTIFWVAMSTLPEYAEKINLMAAMSPLAFLNHTTSPVKILSPFIDELKGIFVTLKTKRFNPPKLQSIINSYLPRMCFFRLASRGLCTSVNSVLKDFGMTRFESHHVEQLSKYAPTTTSIKTMIHLLQLIKANQFQNYDYGADYLNEIEYGTKYPFIYNLTNVNVPVAIFSGIDDAFSELQDVELLKTNLPNVVEHVVVDSTFKTHIDYTHEPKAADVIYSPIIKLLNMYTSNNSLSDVEIDSLM